MRNGFMIKIWKIGLFYVGISLFLYIGSPVYAIPFSVKTTAKYALLVGVLYDLKKFCAVDSYNMKQIMEKNPNAGYTQAKAMCAKEYLIERGKAVLVAPIAIPMALIIGVITALSDAPNSPIERWNRYWSNRYYSQMAKNQKEKGK